MTKLISYHVIKAHIFKRLFTNAYNWYEGERDKYWYGHKLLRGEPRELPETASPKYQESDI